MRQKLSSILWIIVLIALPLRAWTVELSAQDLKSVVPGLTNAEAELLAQKDKVTHFFESKGHPRFVPASSLAAGVRREYRTVDHTIGVEALFIMKPGNDGHNAEMLRWYNILRSVSTMKGIEYYSVTRRRTRVLFRNSYVIDNPEDQRRLPDPLVTSIPASSTLTIKQDDSTFGEALFQLHYTAARDAISLSMVNLNTFHLWFIPVIGDHHMILQLVLVPYKGNLLFYGGVEVKTISLFGLQNATRDSLVNRIDALHKWFEVLAKRG
jgi:hypothetical protein